MGGKVRRSRSRSRRRNLIDIEGIVYSLE